MIYDYLGEEGRVCFLNTLDPTKVECLQAGRVIYITEVTIGHTSTSTCSTAQVLCGEPAPEAEMADVIKRLVVVFCHMNFGPVENRI